MGLVVSGKFGRKMARCWVVLKKEVRVVCHTRVRADRIGQGVTQVLFLAHTAICALGKHQAYFTPTPHLVSVSRVVLVVLAFIPIARDTLWCDRDHLVWVEGVCWDGSHGR